MGRIFARSIQNPVLWAYFITDMTACRSHKPFNFEPAEASAFLLFHAIPAGAGNVVLRKLKNKLKCYFENFMATAATIPHTRLKTTTNTGVYIPRSSPK